MSLTIPTIGSEAGPTYASDINNSLTRIDTHDHTPGNGELIIPQAMNISSDLTFKGNSATNLASMTFLIQSSAPSAVTSLYVQNGSESPARPDLWYFDGTSNVQLTSGGNIATTITRLPGQTYNSGTGTFIWKQGSGSTTPAFFDIAALTIRPAVAATVLGTTIQPSSGLAASNTLTLPSVNVQLPTSLPSATAFLTLDSYGNISPGASTSSGITGSNIASATVTGSNIAAGTITSSNIAAGTITNSNISSSAGITGGQIATNTIATSNIIANSYGISTTPSFSNFNTAFATVVLATVTTAGHPVLVTIGSRGGNLFTVSAANTLGSTQNIYLQATRDGTVIASWLFTVGGGSLVAPGGFTSSTFDFHVIDGPGSGTHTYGFQAAVSTTGYVSVSIYNVTLVACEL